MSQTHDTPNPADRPKPVPRGFLPDSEEAAEAGRQVARLLEHPGWAHLLSVLQAHVALEQKLVYQEPRPVEIHERLAAKTNSYRELPNIARGVVIHGRKAQERMSSGSTD